MKILGLSFRNGNSGINETLRDRRDRPLLSCALNEANPRIYRSGKFIDNTEAPILFRINGMQSLRKGTFQMGETAFDTHCKCLHVIHFVSDGGVSE